MRLGLLLLLGVVVSGLTLTIPVLAQDRPNGFDLTSPLRLSSGYDDNFVVGSRMLDDTVSILTSPTFSWMKSTHQTRFSVGYETEFELFSRNGNLDAWNHAANLHFNHQLNS